MVTGSSLSKANWALGFGIIVLISCLHWLGGLGYSWAKDVHPLQDLQTAEFRSGDLVFRAGKGWRSDAVRLASGTSLTHVGIVDRDEGGDIFVIHSDAPSDVQSGGVKRVQLSQFSHPELADDIVLYRLPFSDSVVKEMTDKARGYAARSIPFDDAFRLHDSTRLYCTELVWRSLLEAGEMLPPRATEISLPGLDEEIMMPSDLLKLTKANAIPAGLPRSFNNLN